MQRYIKITELIPALLDKVDDGTMGFTPAVQLSYLKKKEQQEKPQARSSLKERLAAKQKEVAQGKNKDAKEQNKTKKTNREEI